MSLFVLISSLEIRLKAPILPGNVSKRFGPLENTIIYISCHLQIAAVVQFWKLQTLSWNPSSSGYWPVQLQQYPFSLGLSFFLTINEDATYFPRMRKNSLNSTRQTWGQVLTLPPVTPFKVQLAFLPSFAQY